MSSFFVSSVFVALGAGWKVKHFKEICLYDHSPSPQVGF